jgi:DNA-binding SARP family transcriptional activator/TolB-like protein
VLVRQACCHELAEYKRAGLCVKMFGPFTIIREGAKLTLPASRKSCALVAYLALAARPMGRSHLCELLWDAPNDPRGELRWCLSKIRRIFDENNQQRVHTSGDRVELELGSCFVDVVEVIRATQPGVETLDQRALRTLSALMAGEFLEGMEFDRSPVFSAWLVTQRRRFRDCHIAVLEQIIRKAPARSDEVFGFLEKWLQLDPLDSLAHEMLLDALASRGQIREGEKHLAATVRLYEAEGLDPMIVRSAWRTANRQPRTALPGAPIGSGRLDPHRASVAVMPLVDITANDANPSGLARGLVQDVITRLAKLRLLSVIAPGSVFAIGERGFDPEAAGRALRVDYMVSGLIRRRADRFAVVMELAETRSARIIWAEDFDCKLDDTFLLLDEIGNRIVASIAGEIEIAERKRALLKPPASLNAWEAYHRGLWHAYRFNKFDNEEAQRFFQRAVDLDPTFSRAYAGLSFTHFQNAFLHRSGQREWETDQAYATAAEGLNVDDRDPAAHWAMGRALWLRYRPEQCIEELEKVVELSPNFALGHYMLAFALSQAGDPQEAIRCSDRSRHLSPFDPLLFAMLAARAMAHMRLGQFDEAADWAVKGARRPNAHVHTKAIAAHCLASAGRIDEARSVAALIHRTHPNYRVDDFLEAFRFAPDVAPIYLEQASTIGMR